MDNSAAIRPSQLPQRTHVVVVPESDWERAVVKWFNRLRGFGFLTRGPKLPTSSCIWKHYGALASPNSGLARPCFCVTATGPSGLMAAEIKPDTVRGHPLTDADKCALLRKIFDSRTNGEPDD